MTGRSKHVLAGGACCLLLLVGCNSKQQDGAASDRPSAPPVQSEHMAGSKNQTAIREPISLSATKLQYAPAVVQLAGRLGIATGQYADGETFQYLALTVDTPISIEGNSDDPPISGVLKIGVIPENPMATGFDALVGRHVIVAGSLHAVPAGRGPSVNLIADEINESAAPQVAQNSPHDSRATTYQPSEEFNELVKASTADAMRAVEIFSAAMDAARNSSNPLCSSGPKAPDVQTLQGSLQANLKKAKDPANLAYLPMLLIQVSRDANTATQALRLYCRQGYN